MLKSERVLTLDIGADGIRMAVVEPAVSGAPKWIASASRDFDVSSGLPKDALTAMTLKQLLDEIRPGTKRTRISIDGQSVFSRLVKLPRVGKDQVDKTVRHEAVQNIPFPLEEVVWDAHIIDPESGEPEILLVAVKAELVDGLVHAVRANGLDIERITVATAALANAAHTFIKPDEPTLLANSNDTATNLVFMEGPRVFFRTLPISGKDSARLEQEIERSISFYTGQQGGNQPQQIVKTPEFGEADASFAVCMGLACTPEISIDLIPPSLMQERDLKSRSTLWFASAVVLMLILGVWIFGLQKRIQRAEAKMGPAMEQLSTLRKIERQLLPLEKRAAELEGRLEVYANVISDRGAWVSYLAELGRILPEGMFLLDSRPADGFSGLRVSVVSFLDQEPEGQDAVKMLRDAIRASDLFSDQTKVESRPSKKEFARVFVLDVYFEEAE